jgi:hypothetical protein
MDLLLESIDNKVPSLTDIKRKRILSEIDVLDLSEVIPLHNTSSNGLNTVRSGNLLRGFGRGTFITKHPFSLQTPTDSVNSICFSPSSFQHFETESDTPSKDFRGSWTLKRQHFDPDEFRSLEISKPRALSPFTE